MRKTDEEKRIKRFEDLLKEHGKGRAQDYAKANGIAGNLRVRKALKAWRPKPRGAAAILAEAGKFQISPSEA